MAIVIGDNISLNSKQFLDERQGSASSLEDLRLWNFEIHNIPDGFEVWVEEKGKWYTYNKKNTYLPETTGYFRERIGAVDGSLPVYTKQQYEALSDGEKPKEFLSVDAMSGTPSPSDIQILFASIRALQAEVLRLKNSFGFGINSYKNNETAASSILYDMDDVEEEEPLWAVQESELSELFSMDFYVTDDLRVLTGSVTTSSDNLYLNVNGEAEWPARDGVIFDDEGDVIRLEDITDPKLFMYVTTSKDDVAFQLNEVSGTNKCAIDIHQLLDGSIGANTYATLLCVARTTSDVLTGAKYGKAFIWIVVQDLTNNEVLIEGYLNPGSSYISPNPVYLDKNYYISKVNLKNLKLSKLTLCSKYQDFSDHVEAVKPTELEDIKYKAAHITIRSVENESVLDAIIKQLQEDELIYVKKTNALFIKSNGVKHKLGSSSKESGDTDNMTTQILLENLANQGLISLKGAQYDNDGNLTGVTDVELAKIASMSLINEDNGEAYTYKVNSNGELVGNKETPDKYTFHGMMTSGTTSGLFPSGGDLPKEDELNNSATASRGFIARMHGTDINKSITSDIGLNSDRIKIGSFYIPRSDDNTFGCSHGFIELENTAQNDYYLDGCYLHFAGPIVGYKKDTDGNITATTVTQATYHLPLSGKIPAGGTYLVRCCKYADASLPTTFIKVNSYDKEWFVTSNSISFNAAAGYSYNIAGQLLDMTYRTDGSNITYGYALTYGQSGLTYDTDVVDNTQINADKVTLKAYLIDSLNVFTSVNYAHWHSLKDASTINCVSACLSNSIYKNTFELDPAKQAFQSYTTADSSRLRGLTGADNQIVELNSEYIQLPNSDDVYPVSKFTPKASFEGKNVISDKSQLDNDKPNMPTVSFGIDIYKTRCFNWVSVGEYDEFVWIRKKGSTQWTNRFQSYFGNSNVTSTADTPYTYTRKEFSNYAINYAANANTTVEKVVYANPSQKNVYPGCNVNYVSHKCIIDINGLDSITEPVTFEYVVGRSTSVNKQPMDGHVSEILTFTVYPKTWTPKIYQITDQQGFHWLEYQAWSAAANEVNNQINKECTSTSKCFPILINTGDMTQNGTRVNEWLDYYNAGKVLFNHLEQMNVIGNNDLGNVDEKALGTGDDPGKSNPHFYNMCYCYEVPMKLINDSYYLPIYYGTQEPKYIPSLYYFDTNDFRIIMLNSEITGTASLQVWNSNDVDIYTGYNWLNNTLNSDDSTAVYKAASEMSVSGKSSNHYVYEVLYQWMKEGKDNAKKQILCCHEMPFTVVTSDNLTTGTSYSDRSISVTGKSTGLIGSHCNRNAYKKAGYLDKAMPVRSKGTYWLSRLMENFDVKYCLGGHKHTYACTWPLRENYYYMSGSTMVNSLENGAMTMPASLANDSVYFILNESGVPVTTGGTLGNNYAQYKNLTKFPIAKASNFNGDNIKGTYAGSGIECITKDKSEGQTYVIYFMLQATGFKLKSNKELPGTMQKFSQIIPKTAGSKPSTQQIFPMFASVVLNKASYATGLDFCLMAIANIVPNNQTEVLNQQSVYDSKYGCMHKPVIKYFHNQASETTSIPYGDSAASSSAGENCWNDTPQLLNLHI